MVGETKQINRLYQINHLIPLDQKLLLLLEIIHNADRDLERAGNDIRRRESQPLSETDVSHPVRLVDLDPDQVRGPRVSDVVARVVWEDSGVAGREVECARCGSADENGGLGVTLVEVEPFFRLFSKVSQDPHAQEGSVTLTLGCQCSSRNPPGSKLMTAAAMVVEIGKFLLSMILRFPPPPGIATPAFWD